MSAYRQSFSRQYIAPEPHNPVDAIHEDIERLSSRWAGSSGQLDTGEILDIEQAVQKAFFSEFMAF